MMLGGRLFIFLLICGVVWSESFERGALELDDSNLDEDLLFAKYQFLIAETMAGRGVDVGEFSDTSDESIFTEDEAERNEFLERMKEKEKAEEPILTLESSSTVLQESAEPEPLTIERTDSVEPMNINVSSLPSDIISNEIQQPALLNEVAEEREITYIPIDLDIQSTKNEIELTLNHTISIDGDPVAENEASSIVVDSILIRETNSSMEREDELFEDSRSFEVKCPDLAAGIPSLLAESGILEIATKLENYSRNGEVVPLVIRLLSELEKRLHNGLEPSQLESLSVVNQDEVSSIQDLQACREQTDFAISQQFSSEQQRDLTEIRLKKCRNEVSILKASADQQYLSIEESKVDLEFRLKEIQRENARLRISLEDLKRSKLMQHQQQIQNNQNCECPTSSLSTSGSQSASILHSSSEQSHSATKPNGNTSPPKPGLSASGTGSEKLPHSAENNSQVSFGRLSSLPRHDNATTVPVSNEELSIGRFLRYNFPNWLRKQFFPYLLSFLVWEYRLLFSGCWTVFNLVDPRIWENGNQRIVQPIYKVINEWHQMCIRNHSYFWIKLEPNSWLVAFVTSSYSYLEANYRRYQAIVSSSFVGDRLVSPELINGTDSLLSSTSINEGNHSSSLYAVLIETFIEDCVSVFDQIAGTLAQIHQVKLLFGNNAIIACQMVVLSFSLVVMVLYRKVLLGLWVLNVLVTFLPVLLILLLISSVLGMFMPKRRKVMKTKAKKSAENHNNRIHNSSFGSQSIGSQVPYGYSHSGSNISAPFSPPTGAPPQSSYYSSNYSARHQSLETSVPSPSNTSPRAFVSKP
jgi:hypothetical protein